MTRAWSARVSFRVSPAFSFACCLRACDLRVAAGAPAGQALLRIERMSQYDRLLAIRSRGDDVDRYFDQRLQAFQVLARVQRQGRIVGDPHGRFLPAGQFLVYRLQARVAFDAERRLRHDLITNTIADGHSDSVETVEHIKLGDAKARDARVDDGAPESHGVEPSAAPPPPGDRAELVADAREMLSVAVEELGRERTRAHPRRISLHDPEHVIEDPRPQTRTGARKARGGVG